MTDENVKILKEDGWEPQPDNISLRLPSGEDMVLESSEWGTSSDLIKGIGAFLCPNGTTQQNLDILYEKHRQDIHISRQER